MGCLGAGASSLVAAPGKNAAGDGDRDGCGRGGRGVPAATPTTSGGILAGGALDGGVLDGEVLDGGSGSGTGAGRDGGAGGLGVRGDGDGVRGGGCGVGGGGCGVRRGLGVGRGRGGGAATVRTEVASAIRPQSYTTTAEAVSVVPALIRGPRRTVTESPSAERAGTSPQSQRRPSRRMRHEPPAPPLTAATVVPAGRDRLRCTSQAGPRSGLAIETR